MKALITLVIALSLGVALPVASQPILGVYSDAGGTSDCHLTGVPFTPVSVWVVHTGPDALASRLQVTYNWTAIVLGVYYPILYIVNPDILGGDIIPYGICRTMPWALARIDFMSMVSTPPCGALIQVGPDPAAASGRIEVEDCSHNVVYAQTPAPWLWVNGDASCPCNEPPVSAELSTWGKVKSLYR